MGNALELSGLTKTYSDFTLEHIDLTLPEGCIMGLIGENGAGKSTMIKAILGAIRPDAGKINVLGCDVAAPDFVKIKAQLGIVLDEANFPLVLTSAQVNRVMKDIYPNWQEDVFFSYLKRFGLPENKRFQDFSKGMKMKLSIATALSHQATLLILDEATSGLDPIARDEILDVFNEFTRQENHSILISSHITSDLEKICDYIAFLHKGRLRFCEEKDVLRERYGIVHCSKDTFAQLDRTAVVGSRDNGYGIEALVERSKIPAALTAERVAIEDIIVFMARERSKA